MSNRLKGNQLKNLLVIITVLISGMYFALASFAYFNIAEIAPLVIDNSALSILIAIAIGFGVIQFISVISFAIAELLSKDSH